MSGHFGMPLNFGEYIHSGLRRMCQKLTKRHQQSQRDCIEWELSLRKEKELREIREMHSTSSRKCLGVATQMQPKNWRSVISTEEGGEGCHQSNRAGVSNLKLKIGEEME